MALYTIASAQRAVNDFSLQYAFLWFRGTMTEPHDCHAWQAQGTYLVVSKPDLSLLSV